MADGLRSLVGTGTARALQEKLESWQQDYEINSSGENVDRCCEILELNSEIQKQLFTILNETSKEDCHKETVKSCVLPHLGTCCSCAPAGKPLENSLSLTQSSTGSEMQLTELETPLPCRLQELEEKLTSTRVQLNQMKQDLNTSCAEEECAVKKLERLNDYEQQLQMLRDEITLLDAHKCVLKNRLARSCSPCRRTVIKAHDCCSPPSCCSGQARNVNDSRRACLVARFGFIYAKERFDAETFLRTYINDLETVQRIVYTAAVESFHAAKMAYWKFKTHVREMLCPCHCGPESLEDAVLDYIVCHTDQYDVHCSVKEVICSMNINPKISVPPEIDLNVLSPLIQELCCLAFSMQTLIPPLDIAFGIDGEVFDETKYYRGSGSDFTAAFVAYHVWPALVENGVVIVRGEVVTKKMSLMLRSRSFSPKGRNSRC